MRSITRIWRKSHVFSSIYTSRRAVHIKRDFLLSKTLRQNLHEAISTNENASFRFPRKIFLKRKLTINMDTYSSCTWSPLCNTTLKKSENIWGRILQNSNVDTNIKTKAHTVEVRCDLRIWRSTWRICQTMLNKCYD